MGQSNTVSIEAKRKQVAKFANTINERHAKSCKDGRPLVLTGEALAEGLKPVFISTGVEELDNALGGGFCRGCLTVLYGKADSGKTGIAVTTAAEVQSLGGAVLWISTEGLLPQNLFNLYNIDLSMMVVMKGSNYAEESVKVIGDAIKSIDADGMVFDLVVVDSITAFTPKSSVVAQEEKGLEGDNQPGRLAVLTSKWFADIIGRNLLREDGMMLVISQERVDIGGYGAPTKATGGKAMEHYPKVIVNISRVGKGFDGKIDGQEASIGHTVKFNIKKNHVNSRLLSGEYGVLYNVGIDDSTGIVAKAIEKEIIIKNGREGYSIKLPTGEIQVGIKIDDVRERFKTDTELKNSVKDLMRNKRGSKTTIVSETPVETNSEA